MQNPKLKRQLLLCEPDPKSAKDLTDNTEFRLNPEFALMWVPYDNFFKNFEFFAAQVCFERQINFNVNILII